VPDDDGVVEIPLPGGPAADVAQHGNEDDSMPETVDLSPNVANALMTETVGNIQQTNAAARNIANIATGVLQSAAARNFDELGAVESRATSGALATPIAAPTTGGA